MGRLSFRLGAAMVVLAIAILLGVGVVTSVSLRSLHAQAKEANLALLSRTLLTQSRTEAMRGNLRAAIRDLDSVLEEQGVTPWLLLADGRLHGLDGGPGIEAPADLDRTGPRGTGDSGTSTFADGERYSWASTLLRAAGATTGPRAVVFTAPDDSGALAIRDVFRALPLVVVLTVIVGGILGWLIHRSVTGPLGRLAGATEAVGLDGSPRRLPLEGPTEVRELTGQFNAMTAELAASRDRETELLANLRHDLRTPLTVISGFAAALLDGRPRDPSASEPPGRSMRRPVDSAHSSISSTTSSGCAPAGPGFVLSRSTWSACCATPPSGSRRGRRRWAPRSSCSRASRATRRP